MDTVYAYQVDQLSSKFLQGKRQQHNAVASQILAVLKIESYRRNTITLSEFSKYLPIFDTKLVSKMSYEDSVYLGQEWASRIDPYEEVRIVEYEDSKEPLFVLPALYTRVPSVNMAGAAGLYAEEALTKNVNNDSPISCDAERCTARYANVLDRVRHIVQPYYEARQKQYAKTMDDLKKKNILSSNEIPTKKEQAPEQAESSNLELIEEPL